MDNEQPNNGGSSLRLPQFWAEVNALPKESLRTVLDLITDPPEDDPYQQLKDRLCITASGS